MPKIKMAERGSPAHPPEEEEEVRAKRPRREPVEEQATGRPYQGFVEREAGKFWQETVKTGCLAKPEQQETRTAGRPEQSPDYAGALLQPEDDAGWLVRELRLPDHPQPKHPPVYYLLDLKTHRPVAMKGDVLHGDYVYRLNGRRVTNARYIHPWESSAEHPEPDATVLKNLGWDACYVLRGRSRQVWVEIYNLVSIGNVDFLDSTPLGFLHFSPVRPPVL